MIDSLAARSFSRAVIPTEAGECTLARTAIVLSNTTTLSPAFESLVAAAGAAIATSASLVQLQSTLAALSSQAAAELDGFEETLALEAFSVAASSAAYWSGYSGGGGTVPPEMTLTGMKDISINWRGIAGEDYFGLVAWARVVTASPVLLAACGASTGGCLARGGLAAASASAIEAVKQQMY